jgi:outer membrane protein with beta-barrel domain
MVRPRLTTLFALTALVAPVAAHAQANRPAVSLSAGAFQYDLSGTGTTPMLAARAELPLSRLFLVEGGLTAARPAQQFGATTTFLAPEVQLQVQAPLAGGRVAPYLGLGGGGAFDLRGAAYGGDRNTVTVSGATGLRYWLSDTFGVRGELRVRGIGTGFGGSAAEYTLGTAWRF